MLILSCLVNAAPVPQRAPTFATSLVVVPAGYALLSDAGGTPRACKFDLSEQSDYEAVPTATSLSDCAGACEADHGCTGFEFHPGTDLSDCHKWKSGACNGSADDIPRLVCAYSICVTAM